MLRNKSLFNPIEITERMPDELFRKYIEIRDKQYRLLPTTPELTTRVRTRFFDSHTDVDKQKLGQVWDFMYQIVQRNEALAQFILDNNGAESEFFFPWVKSVATSPSEALELAYNAGRNLNGDWVENIPEDDEINYFVRTLPTLAYNRERQLRVADLVTSDREMAGADGSKVIDLGAGRMAWARHHGFKFKPRIQQILACDVDKSINAAKLFAPKSLAEVGVAYEKADLRTELQNPASENASLAILQGVASYYPIEAFREAIVKPVYGLLRNGGNFFFDLQLEHISYVWSVKVFDWPEMKLPKSAAEAINIVETMRQMLWNDGMKFQAEYALDTYNASPLSVMVLLTKI